MIALILKALTDSLLQSLFGFLQAEMRDRGLIQQGREQQRGADLEVTVEKAKDAAIVEESVRKLPDADLDQQLERVRDAAAGGH